MKNGVILIPFLYIYSYPILIDRAMQFNHYINRSFIQRFNKEKKILTFQFLKLSKNYVLIIIIIQLRSIESNNHKYHFLILIEFFIIENLSGRDPIGYSFI